MLKSSKNVVIMLLMHHCRKQRNASALSCIFFVDLRWIQDCITPLLCTLEYYISKQLLQCCETFEYNEIIYIYILFYFIFNDKVMLFFFFCTEFCHTLKWNAMGLHVMCSPSRSPFPPPSPPDPSRSSQCTRPSACLMHPTWAGDLFHPR